MEASNLQIYWHESQPIYSLCFQPDPSNKPKLITGGGDNKVRVWHLNFEETHKTKIETIDFLSSLNQHEQAINVVRFNHKGDTLASAGDDGQLLLWKQSDQRQTQFGESDTAFEESWTVTKRFRSSSSRIGAFEIYDIAWSPNDDYIVTGSMDNAIRVFEISSGECIATASDHTHYVQGVVWDPLDKYIFSQSADRSVHVYEVIRNPSENEIVELKIKNKIMKSELPVCKRESKDFDLQSTKLCFLFHNETLPSFFRRPAMSPCGSILCVPAGIFRTDSSAEGATSPDVNNAVQIYTRSSMIKNINKPVMCIPFLKKPAIVVSFNPNLYKLTNDSNSYLQLPYKLVFAVATSNEVIIYDTESIEPIALIGNLHYTTLTDLCWSKDGALLMISSTDGFCSYISIAPGTLGEKLTHEETAKAIGVKRKQYNKDSSSEPAPCAEASPSPSHPKQADIVNILPVKRKLGEKEKEMEERKTHKPSPEDERVAGSENSPQQLSKEKRRVQPTFIDLKKNTASPKK